MVAGRNRTAERLALEAEGLAKLVLQLRAEETRLRATLERVTHARRMALACLGAKATAASDPAPSKRRNRRRS